MARTLSEAEFEQVKAKVLAAAPPNLTEAEFTRYAGPAMAQAIGEAENTPAVPEGSALGRLASNAGGMLNPVTMVTGLYGALSDPTGTGQRMGAVTRVEAGKAVDAYRQGRYSEMLGHAAAAAIPIVGPAAAASGEQIASGDVAGGVGSGLGLIGSMFLPKAIPKSVPVLPRLGRNVPAPVAEAVQYGLREGVPVDVATATGNPFLRGAQKLSEESLLGSTLVRPAARAAQAEALTRVGEGLAAKTSRAPVTAEIAGQALKDRLANTAAVYDAAADVGYGKLRAIEAQRTQLIQQQGGVQAPATHARPFTAVPLAVDLAPTKAAMVPVYEALTREAQLVPLMGDKARALTALDRMMRAPDLAPLSVADSALGELKDVARVDQTFRRTVGQGIAAQTVANLEAAVTAAAKQAGPDAVQALMEGRAATVNKFKTIKVLDQLGKTPEPVAVYRRVTAPKDAGITQLRDLARLAPTEVRQIGRAWLEEALTRAKGAEGAFGGAQGALAEWQQLGPQTKLRLFGDPAHIKDLDSFFLLAKKMTENINPSGSASTLIKGGEVGALLSGAGLHYTLSAPVIAKLLLSPRTTRVLLQGLRLPVSATAARTAWAGELGRLLQEQAPALVPAVTGEPADATR